MALVSLILCPRAGTVFSISVEYTEHHASYQTALQTSYIAACDSVKAVRV